MTDDQADRVSISGVVPRLQRDTEPRDHPGPKDVRPPARRPDPITAGPAGRTGSRLAGIEGLRAIAATSIVVFHCWLYSSPSGQRVNLGPLSRFVFPYLPVGVTLFFSLSAFLLYRPIAESLLAGRPRLAVRRYLRNRALRVLPAYWIVLAAMGILVGGTVVRLSPVEVGIGSLLGHPSMLARNITLSQNYFPDTVITGIAPAWSLAVEVVFYLLLPVLGWLAALVVRRVHTDAARIWASLLPAGILFVVGLSGKAAAIWLIPPGGGPSPGWDGDWHSVVVRSFWDQADLFAFGIGLAVLWVCVESGRITLPRWWRPVALVALVPIVLSTTQFREGQVLGASGWATVLALGCSILLALVVLEAEPRPRRGLIRLLETRVMVAIGLVSYSLFLWHEPLVRWLASQGLTFDGRRGFFLNLVIVGAASGVLAALTYRFVERPALRRKATATPPRGAAAPAPSTSIANAARP
jgi:peptidoglycan/LPS O-acetylase OafA/YrhL